ncbi:MAG: GDSL-type esterase/lipase family protein [Allomuricauda sp.]
MISNTMFSYLTKSFSLRSIFLALIILIGLGCDSSNGKIKVSCVGDSITFGARLENPSADSYPAQLQKLLGDEYVVTNHGVGGSTLLKKGIPNVWSQLSKIKSASPDIVVISLGTNDTCGMGTCGNRKCWEYVDEFAQDYNNLIDELRSIPSKPDIWICAPSPMVIETPGLSSERVEGLSIRKPRLQKLIITIKEVAREKNVKIIDLNTPLRNKPELFTEKDGVHPNKSGYKTIAKLVYNKIKK